MFCPHLTLFSPPRRFFLLSQTFPPPPQFVTTVDHALTIKAMRTTTTTTTTSSDNTSTAFCTLNPQCGLRLNSVQCMAKSKSEGGRGIEWRKKEVEESTRSSSPQAQELNSRRGSNGARNIQRERPRQGGEGIHSQRGGGRGSSIKRTDFESDRRGEDGGRRSIEAAKATKHPKIKEQVKILSPLNKNPNVAILGGGMSGIMCALALQERGIRSTVFDTGKHGLGGRMATRHIAQVNAPPLVFEHGAQYFTATDPRFRKLVNQWLEEGAVREWNGVVGTLEKGGNFTESQSCTKYIATNGMRLLADHLLSKRKLIEVRRPCWISKMLESGGIWHLFENEKDHGDYDIVVIAHNGKCANRLLGPVGVPLVAKQMKRLELSSIWALMAAFEQPLPSVTSGNEIVQVGGAFVKGIDAVSWMGNNTSKLNTSEISGPYCWTFFSTAAYGKKNKVPQESIPTARAEKVKREMLWGVEQAFGLEEGSLPTPLFTRVQLWGAALPVNTPNIPCIFDANGRVGICGDWLLGSNLEAAALSGMAMANQISMFSERSGLNPDEFNIGLEEWFSPVGGHDIGEFAGVELAEPVRKLQPV